MIPTLAAVAAVTVALLELSVGPHLNVGGGGPHFVLVVAIVWTVIAGIDGGLVWAFVGGLALDFLAPRPLGSSAFVLLAAVGLAALISGLLGPLRMRYFAPAVVIALLSPFYSLGVYIVSAALSGPFRLETPVSVLVPGLILDVLIAAALGPVAVALRARLREQERFDW